MKKEQLLELGLTEEQADKVLNLHKEVLSGFIPKARFDEVNETKKELEQQIQERDNQLKELQEQAKGNEELEKTIKELQEANKATKEQYEDKIKDMTITAAIQSKLTDAKYPDLLLTKFDRSKLSIAEDGTVLGIDEQLTALISIHIPRAGDDVIATRIGSIFGQFQSTSPVRGATCQLV